MAVIPFTVTDIQTAGNRAQVITWANMATGDTGDPYEQPGYSDRSVQITGTFGGSTVTFRGSNNGSTYVTLNDPQGTAISKTSADLEGVMELTRYVRPEVSGGAGVSVTVTLFVKKVL